jgi:ElaA protein
MLEIKIKTFKELTTQELYNVLQLRSEVFVVEQDCVYQDIDGKDQKALHILGYKNDRLVAYTRIFNYGFDIMKASINAIREHYNQTLIKISAQTYLKRFYNNLEFFEVGEEYLEDDIPHIAMIKS